MKGRRGGWEFLKLSQLEKQLLIPAAVYVCACVCMCECKCECVCVDGYEEVGVPCAAAAVRPQGRRQACLACLPRARTSKGQGRVECLLQVPGPGDFSAVGMLVTPVVSGAAAGKENSWRKEAAGRGKSKTTGIVWSSNR